VAVGVGATRARPSWASARARGAGWFGRRWPRVGVTFTPAVVCVKASLCARAVSSPAEGVSEVANMTERHAGSVCSRGCAAAAPAPWQPVAASRPP
jgi:hypothetical protein